MTLISSFYVYVCQGELVSYEGNPIVLDSSIPEDQALKEIVALYREQVTEKMGVEVGEALSFINGGRPLCRWEECAFGDLVTDAMAKEMHVKIAMINSGAIKNSFEQGTYVRSHAGHDISFATL